MFEDGAWGPFRHADTYGLVEGDGLAAAPAEAPIQLLASLLDAMTPPVTLRLDVLDPMGLESSEPVAWTAPGDAIRTWLSSNATWLEGDARLAVSLADADGLSVRFDEHDLIWLSGDLGRFEPFLLAAGLLPGDINLPYPHAHQYREEWTPVFKQMMARLRSPQDCES